MAAGTRRTRNQYLKEDSTKMPQKAWNSARDSQKETHKLEHHSQQDLKEKEEEVGGNKLVRIE